MVWIIENGARLPNPRIDISEEVGNWRDHGCLGLALDPAFLSNGRRALWSRNAQRNNDLNCTGASNDRAPLLLQIGGTIPTAMFSGYIGNDLNLDGFTKYAGGRNQRVLILLNIGGATPTMTRSEQLP
jgi:hypothetical protein